MGWPCDLPDVVGGKAKKDTRPHLGQSLILTVALLVSFALPHLPIFSFLKFRPAPAVCGTGLALTFMGAAFFVWARHTLGKNWSQTVSAKEGHELVTSGPYKYARHPMYFGDIVSCIGSAMVAGRAFVIMCALLTPLFIWRVFAEDRLLARQFPGSFPDYKKRTKALIPFIW